MTKQNNPYALFVIALIILTFTWNRLLAQDTDDTTAIVHQQQALLADHQPAANQPATSLQLCQNGLADIYPCHGLDLMAFLPLAQIGGGQANDIWGWTDPLTGKEYALLGRTVGTAFIDISEPTTPIYLGNLPSHTGSSIWRDIKTYANYAFIVSDNNNNHGMQVFDLTQLRDVSNPPLNFSQTAHYDGLGSAHNLAINEATGYAYIVGGSAWGDDCNGGLHMVNIQDPLHPTFAGCFSGDGYTHDAQCVLYHGPDAAYQGHEICFNANVETLTIVDVTDKSAPTQVARLPYSGSAYAHQGWLTADHHYFFLGDELDETHHGHNTRTYVWNVGNLENALLIGSYTANTPAIDHNMYTYNGRLYQANYRAGLRVLNIGNAGNLSEMAYFDIYPGNDSPNFNGAWSNYPFFDSGSIIVSGIEQGLFVLRHSYMASLGPDVVQHALPGGSRIYHFSLRNQGTHEDTYSLSLGDNGWPTALLTTPSLTLAAGTTTTVSVSVTVPSVMWGEMDSFTLLAVSANDPAQVRATAVGTTLVAPTPAVQLSPATQTQLAEWDDTVTHTLSLINTGDYTDTFTFALSGNHWPTTTPTSTAPLLPGQAVSISVAVQVPNPFAGGGPILANDEVVITAVSTLNPLATAQATGTTHVDVEAGLALPGDIAASAAPGETVTYTITLTNTGEITDTFTVTLGNSQWPSSVDTTLVGPLAVNGRDSLTVSVTVGAGSSDTLTLTFTSYLDNSFSRSLTLTTSRDLKLLYLPFTPRP